MKTSIQALYFISFTLMLVFSSPLVSQQVGLDLPGYEYRNIGPSNPGGRIVDIDAHDDDFTKVYIAAASGGVWKSENAGTSWTPIFDDYETASIGDIALDQKNKNTLWVGTGEANNRNSVSWGNGIYKSTDGGKSFQNKGLESTHQIARVLVHPDKSDEVCVCAIGHLWGYSGERGLFHTTDGGDTWKKLTNGLPNDGKTGCNDLLQDPNNPLIMYASFYHRLRQPWHFHSGGEQGGIYKTIDGGKSWKKLSVGLPEGPTGRIGLALYEKNPNIIMALVEAAKTDTLAIPGSGVYRSEDGGESWNYVNKYNNRPFYYSQIRINPSDDQRVYLLTTRFMVSDDGGNTFKNGSEDQEIHGDFHGMWLDPQEEDRYYLGADKGFSLTHDQGKNFRLIDNLPIGQFYRINFDYRTPYYVYGGMQDNGSYATASFSRDARGILEDSNWKMHWGDGQDNASNPTDWTDMYTSMENGSYFKYNPKNRNIRRISPDAYNTVNYFDYVDKNEKDVASAMRFNWSAPLVMSSHNPNHIFIAGNHVYKSIDKGVSWKIISPDLTTNDPIKRVQGKSGGVTPDNTGAETHCSITGLAISPIQEKTIWVGTDDGNIQVSKNGGESWTNVRNNLRGVPEGLWVSKVELSKFLDGRAYVSFDGHRSDNFEPFLYMTDNYGKSWTRITTGFEPNETIRVVREDVKNQNLLFAGTETGVWVSLDRGSKWSRLKLNLPTVSVYDLRIHPRDNDLIVGTHGRSFWILDDLGALQQMSKDIYEKDFHLFEQRPARLWENVSRGGQRGHFLFAGDNPATIVNNSTIPRAGFDNYVALTYFVKETLSDSLTLCIRDTKGQLEQKIKISGEQGIHRYYWNREFQAAELSKADIDELDEILQGIVVQIGNSRTKRLYRRFTEATTSKRIRELVKPLTQDYLNYGLDDKFLIPLAKEGSYHIELLYGDQSSKSSIQILGDPLNDCKK